MTPILDGKLVLVTGAGNGNGAALAKGLIGYGARVIVTDIDEDAAKNTAAAIRDNGGEAWTHRMDVSDLDECRAAATKIAAEVGQIDVLINNAGVLRRTDIDDPEVREAWDFCMDVNATGVFNTIIAFLPHLRATKGNVVNLSSIVAFVAARTFPGYSGSKGAVVSASRSFAQKLAPDGIRVNVVCPGPFATPMTEATRSNTTAGNYYEDRVLLGRFAQPEEIVGPVAFIASNMASFVNGAVLPVDGGLLAQ